jgi:protein-tyrosine phosphatase
MFVPATNAGLLARMSSLRTAVAGLARRLPRPGGQPKMVWITPALAQGPRFTRAQVGALARNGINSVLDVRKEARDDEELLARHGLRLCHVPMTDRAPPTQKQLKQAVDWVMAELANDRKVFIHCQSGVGRSVCVACAVLLRMGYNLSQAYDAVRRKRPEASISEKQVKSLQRYADSLSRQLPTPRNPGTSEP